MKTVKEIVEAYKNGEKMDFLFFWGESTVKNRRNH